MSRRRSVVIAAAIAVPAVLIAGLAVVALMAPRQTADVPVPAQAASPEEVVGAYIAALNAHDCDTAQALSSDGAADSARSWCASVDELDDVRVEGAQKEDPAWSGHRETDEVMYVPVTFDLTWRPLHSDASMPEGDTWWGYLLVREAPSEPWRIVDQGMA